MSSKLTLDESLSRITLALVKVGYLLNAFAKTSSVTSLLTSPTNNLNHAAKRKVASVNGVHQARSQAPMVLTIIPLEEGLILPQLSSTLSNDSLPLLSLWNNSTRSSTLAYVRTGHIGTLLSSRSNVVLVGVGHHRPGGPRPGRVSCVRV